MISTVFTILSAWPLLTSGLVTSLTERQSSPCSGNTPTNRSSWCDYSIDTDYTRVVPNTGVTREYWLDIVDIVASPDGVPRPAMAANGTIPGPTLFADWGDTVVVHVRNSMHTSKNGTSIHFHGIRQLFNNQNDGVVSMTQCPTPVNHTVTYTWRAMQYGSTWYHSHFGLQAWEGVFGGIVINGPATANYDVDLGPLFLTDWDHATAYERSTVHKSYFLPPLLQTGLINGTNTYGSTGQRLNIRFEAGKTYRLRLVNAALISHFKFMIDNHDMTVVAHDLVPVTPYTVKVLDITMGQRYDILVTANQAAAARQFWMRSVPLGLCGDPNWRPNDIRAVVHYDETWKDPSTLGYPYSQTCGDLTDSGRPHVKEDVQKPDVQVSETTSFDKEGDGYWYWTLRGAPLLIEWQDPTLSKLLRHDTNFQKNDSVIELPQANKTFNLVIQNPLFVAHPIHLHGHDFFVLGQGVGPFLPGASRLTTANPPRRDTALLPGSGYLVLGFVTDNPGVWLMHCHIGYHVEMGFALQFVERAAEIPGIVDGDALEEGCAAWTQFQRENGIVQDDSGV
ncbi:laccase Lcc4 [Cordyceps fumosorosea ARSEF 2679]|uniref:Laccase Lcc4 n=1 Tax=Cordyceps fumosorosea (strain ARSEF 2679) TaxID=1081104 RepID=A0A167KSE4_CORFA|nr:laccase Lcc4 [Cordyceps fumosorosea ARSEF 2679]OAA52124.1 laccase Lcc4 [Cordyceps fumosorosea ARSEF 2679]